MTNQVSLNIRPCLLVFFSIDVRRNVPRGFNVVSYFRNIPLFLSNPLLVFSFRPSCYVVRVLVRPLFVKDPCSITIFTKACHWTQLRHSAFHIFIESDYISHM